MYDRFADAAGEVAGSINTLSGLLGYTVDGAFRVVDPDDPRKFFVRFANGNFVSAFHYNRVIQKPGLPVITATDNLGRMYIVGEDKSKSDSYNPSQTAGNNVGWHIHPRGSGMEYITDTWLLKQLRVAPIDGTLGATITAGSYLYRGGFHWFNAATVDLSSFVPADTDQTVWVIVAIDPVAKAIVLLPGDVDLGVIPPDPNLIQLIECYELGYIPLCAVWIQQGDTSLPQFRFEDLRFQPGALMWYLEDLLNVDDGSDYNGYVLTLYDGYWVRRVPSSAGADSNAIHGNQSNEISALTEKMTPVSNDLLIIEDSAASFGKKKVKVGNLPSGSGGGGLGSVLWDLTLTSAGTFDTNNTDDHGNSGPLATDYLWIELIWDVRASAAATGVVVRLTFNNDTTDADYQASGGFLGSVGTLGSLVNNSRNVFNAPGASATSNYFGQGRTTIINPGSAHDKGATSVHIDPRSSSDQNGELFTLLWRSTAAITRFALDVSNATTTFAVGSRLTVIGYK